MTYMLHTTRGSKSLRANSHRQALEKVKVDELAMKPTAKLTRQKFTGAGFTKLVCGRTIVFPHRKKPKKPSTGQAKRKRRNKFAQHSYEFKVRRGAHLHGFRAVA